MEPCRANSARWLGFTSCSNGTESTTGRLAAGQSTCSGSVTRGHDDLDIAVWLKDNNRIAALLAADGWKYAPEEDEDGYTGYEPGAVRLELAFLARSETGRCTRQCGKVAARGQTRRFENDVAELLGVRARVNSLPALKADKADTRDGSIVAAKDHADLATLARFG
jgi:hypothetical protein